MIDSSYLMSWETVSLTLLAWLLTYAIHSCFLIGTVWVITSLRSIRSNRLKDLLWKTAVIGGLVTATIQSLSPLQPFSGRFELSRSSLTLQKAETRIGSFISRGKHSETSRGLTLSLENGRAVIRDRSGKEIKPAPGSPPAEPFSLNRETIEELFKNAGVQAEPSGISWVEWSLAVWFIIACLLSFRLNLIRRRWKKSINARRQITDGPLVDAFAEMCQAVSVRNQIWLSCSPNICAPMALSRSEICLPERAISELDINHQEMMLAHELAHIIRRDTVWLKIYAAMETIFFFQPLNRIARVKLQEEAEYLCDDWAVEHTGRNVNLARCLAEVASWIQTAPQPKMVSSMGGSPSALVRRVERLLEERPCSRAKNRRAWLAILALCLLGAVTWSAPMIAAQKKEVLLIRIKPDQDNIQLRPLPDNKGVVITPHR